jgi:hypothetical protein
MADMRFYKIIIIGILAFAFVACGEKSKPASPVETLKAYTIAVKKKDATTMKLLLSAETLKIHQQEAQAQGLTLDDIVLRQTLFPADQRVFDYKNEKIEGEKASVEVKNNFGGWDIIFLLKEEGIWKIDKKTTSNQMIQEVETTNDDFEDKIEQDRKKIEDSMKNPDSANPNATPGVSPTEPVDPKTGEPNPDDFTPTLIEPTATPKQ